LVNLSYAAPHLWLVPEYGFSTEYGIEHDQYTEEGPVFKRIQALRRRLLFLFTSATPAGPVTSWDSR